LQSNPEEFLEFTLSLGGDREGAVVEVLANPVAAQRELQPGGTQRTAQMRAPFAPVQAGAGETAAGRAQGIDVDAQGFEGDGTFGGQGVVAVVGVALQPALCMQAIVQRDAGGASHVVIAGAGAAQTGRRGRPEFAARRAGDDEEAFERRCHLGAREAEVAVFALGDGLDEALFLETRQMRAGGRCRNICDGGKFSGGACVAIHQATQHAGARRLGDGPGEARKIGIGICIHISIVSEVCLHEKGHTLAMTHTAPPGDAIAAVTHPNPYPWYAALRSAPALVRDDGLRLWIASRADVVRDLLTNDALRVRPIAEPVPPAIAGTPAGEVFGRLVRMNEGDMHATHKPVLQRALAGLDLSSAHAAALRIAEQMPHAPLSGFCLAYPVRAVAHLLGFADKELPQLSDWMRDFVACLSPLSTPGQLDVASSAAAALMDRFERLVNARPAPHGRLLAGVQAEAPPRSQTLLANLVGLLSQTCEATAGLLGNSLAALAREPDLRRKLASRWALLPALVEEVARHDPSVQNTRRFVARSTIVDGTVLAPGDAVLLVLAAANRDPALNPSPATFELMRTHRQTLGFGYGPHACPGQALAFTIAAAGLQALLSGGLRTDALLASGWDYQPSVNARIPRFH